MSELADRLLTRLVTVPKPGTKPFTPSSNWCHVMTAGGNNPPPKAGDSAGYSSINLNLTGAANHGPSQFGMQEMVYAHEPLCKEAADRLRELEDALHMAQYKIGELGRSWSVTTVSYDCQKIQRDIKAVYDRMAPQSTSGTVTK